MAGEDIPMVKLAIVIDDRTSTPKRTKALMTSVLAQCCVPFVSINNPFEEFSKIEELSDESDFLCLLTRCNPISIKLLNKVLRCYWIEVVDKSSSSENDYDETWNVNTMNVEDVNMRLWKVANLFTSTRINRAVETVRSNRYDIIIKSRIELE